MRDNIVTRQYQCPDCSSRDLIMEGETTMCKACGYSCITQIRTGNQRNDVNVQLREIDYLDEFTHKKAKQKTHEQIMAEIKSIKKELSLNSVEKISPVRMCPVCMRKNFYTVQIKNSVSNKSRYNQCFSCNHFEKCEEKDDGKTKPKYDRVAGILADESANSSFEVPEYDNRTDDEGGKNG